MSKNIGQIPGRFTDGVLNALFVEVQRVFDNLTGYWLKDGSVPNSKLALSSRGISPSKINFAEWYFPFSSYVTATTNTAYNICSDVFSFDSSRFPPGTWYLEATLAIANAGAIVTAHLMQAGGSEIAGSVLTHTGDTALTPKRSGALTMPGSVANLYVEFKTSNASYAASFAGAKLVFVPS